MIVLRSGPPALSAASPSMIRAKTPIRLHRTQRLYSVLGGPYSHVNAGPKLAHLAEVKLTHPGDEQAGARGVVT
jgi:hypothetical protein